VDQLSSSNIDDDVAEYAARAALYRARAAETRKFAETAKYPDVKETYLQIALSYEGMASDIEDIIVRQKLSRRPP
jgi:hypothetical protein